MGPWQGVETTAALLSRLLSMCARRGPCDAGKMRIELAGAQQKYVGVRFGALAGAMTAAAAIAPEV